MASSTRLHGPYYNLKHDPQPHSLAPTPSPPPPPSPPPQPPPPPQPFSILQPHIPTRPSLLRNRSLAYCCIVLCSTLMVLFFIIGSSALLVYIIYHPRVPTFSLQSFQINQLNVTILASNLPSAETQSSYAYINSTMLLNVLADNRNRRLGVYYVYFNVSVLYRDENVASKVRGPFVQGKRSKTNLKINLQSSKSLPRDLGVNLKTEEADGSINFRVEVDVEAKLTLSDSQSFPFRVHDSCDVHVSSPSSSGGSGLLQKQCI